jgi:hypothetical protein
VKEGKYEEIIAYFWQRKRWEFRCDEVIRFEVIQVAKRAFESYVIACLLWNEPKVIENLRKNYEITNE